MYRDNKPEGFFYLDHRTVDSWHNIIVDVHVTPGNVNDVEPYIERLDKIIEKFKLPVKYVGLDAGYYTTVICKQLYERHIKAAIAYRLGPHEKNKYTKNKFQYVGSNGYDMYVCPGERPLYYKTTKREGYREYVSNEEHCNACPLKDKCLTGNNKVRTIRRHVWEEFKETVREFLNSEFGTKIYKRRKETVERSFADSKELHGLRYCTMRGLEKVSEQCLLTAAVQNMKKIAMVLFSMIFNYLWNRIYIYC